MSIQTAAPSASETSIHFPIQPGRKLAPYGCSDLRGLCVLFALDETAILETDGTNHFYRYQTDAQGLTDAARLGRHAVEAIADGVAVIGKLLVHAEHRELDVGDLGSLGWLLCGLGEMSKQVNEAAHGAALALTEGRYLQANQESRKPRA